MVPFIGPSYSLNTPKADIQRSINCYPVANEVPGGKTGEYLQQVAGLDLFSEPYSPPVPPDCFHENFLVPLFVNYVAVTGDPACFSLVATPYVNTLSVASQNVTNVAYIERYIAPMTSGSISTKFRLRSLGADDAGVIMIYDFAHPGDPRFAFNPRRDSLVDALHRPYLYVDSVEYPMGSGALSVNVQYQIDVGPFGSGPGGTCPVVISEVAGPVVTSMNVPGLVGVPIDTIRFTNDRGGVTSATEFADIEVCPA
jgi:hypothetical protein